ncbi:acetyl-CoA carboxylase, carboxyltransferase subunit beta [Anaerotignum sp.]|uniref:acetyl-CoA carboxylase, carboxyltransferase subunit beta n=1 Tax=Anaerotignum sp. TaxID=2039241 RepID=UPI0028AFAB53|nr:acetyl-CoA carboxylase, carboxyltransferase subunit beta [Anaerotignum sp.]
MINLHNIVGLFRKSKNDLEKGGITPVVEEKMRCPVCKSTETKRNIAKNKMVCPSCGNHFRIGARTRIKALCDKGSFLEMITELSTNDPLEFPGYDVKLESGKIGSGEDEAVLCGRASFRGQECALFVMEPQFMMGSMGSVVGEKLARLFEYAAEEKLPVVGFTCSGGARMQEGILSLMQMAKVSGAVDYHSKRGGLYITVLTDPTTGGVTASFAMLGDIILSEPNATIGFAGRRVIEQTTKKKLPDNFQKAEFLLDHGFVDAIVPRTELRATIATLLRQHGQREHSAALTDALLRQEAQHDKENSLSPYERVIAARAQNRPTTRAYIERMFTDRTELHGDRKFADDKAIIGGIGMLGEMPVTFIGIERGRNLEERIQCNFGSPMPEGYRKALRLMKQAEKFQRPIICFVDTAGAFCGEEAEERGQGQAIADNLMEMMAIKVPIITIVIGEGGSGGALGLSVASRVYMLENAVFSVISPEGCASILWGEASPEASAEAARCLCITAEDMKRFGVAERIIPENFPYFEDMCLELKETLRGDLKEIYTFSPEISEKRYERFRKLGSWS